HFARSSGSRSGHDGTDGFPQGGRRQPIQSKKGGSQPSRRLTRSSERSFKRCRARCGHTLPETQSDEERLEKTVRALREPKLGNRLIPTEPDTIVASRPSLPLTSYTPDVFVHIPHGAHLTSDRFWNLDP